MSLTEALSGLVHERGKLGQAWFSEDRAYRYLLMRGGDIDDDKPLVTFIMLNPSTADADQNDPTISKCIKFAAGYAVDYGLSPARIAIVNLFAIRSTDPDVAFAHPTPVGGPENDAIISAVAQASDLVIAAWGADKRALLRARFVYRMLRALPGHSPADTLQLHQIGPASKDGHPRHPLYLPYSSRLEVHSW